MKIEYSIVIVTRQRRELLHECLRSVGRETRDHPPLATILVVNGESGEEYKQMLNAYSELRLQLIASQEHLTPAAARNLAIDRLLGEYCLFLDDDTQVSEGYFFQALELLSSQRPVIAGGPDAVYPGSGWLEQAINRALQSPMVTAVTSRRHRPGSVDFRLADEKSITLANLWVATQWFRENPFDGDFGRSEENELLLRAQPDQILLSGKFWVYHKRKTHIPSMLWTVFQSGFYRGVLFRKFGLRAGWVFFIPLLGAVLFLILLLVAIESGVLLLGLYLFTTLFFSLRHGRELFVVVALLQIVMNVYYMLGSAKGLCHSGVNSSGER